MAAELIGRKVLYAERPETLDAASVGNILDSVLGLHRENAEEIDALHRFYRGEQEVKRNRDTIRKGKDFDIVENRAYEIVRFHIGYRHANPSQYINVSKDQDKSKYIELLNTYARTDKHKSKNIEAAEWRLVSGTSYKLCWFNRWYDEDSSPFVTTVLDPRETFVVYAKDDKLPLFAGKTVAVLVAPENEDYEYHTTVYTDSKVFSWIVDDSDFDDFGGTAPDSETINGIGVIPITEQYDNHNRIGIIEVVKDLFDAINSLATNRLENINDIVRALLILLNTELEKDEDGNYIIPRTGDVLMIGNGESNSDAKFISVVLNQAQAQIAKDDYLRALYRIAGVPTPGNNGQSQSGGTTGQAEFVRNDWGLSDSRAKTDLDIYEDCELSNAKVQLEICRSTQGVDIGNLTLHDIGVKTSRGKFDNIQMKAQVFQMLLRTFKVAPEDAAIVADLFDDAAAVIARGEKYYSEEIPEVPETPSEETPETEIIPETV